MLKRENNFTPFEKKVWLASPKMHGEELKYITEAYETNWMSTVGANINEVERLTSAYIGCPYAVGLSSGTAALHMAMRLAGEKLYGKCKFGQGALAGKRVFCTDMTFDATVNPVVYEGGIPVFIETEYDTWNMNPAALENAFRVYPDVKLVVMAHLYGTPAKLSEIRQICDRHDAILIEDAAESLGACYEGKMTGTFGDIGIISFNGNKLITGSSGGEILLKTKEDAERIRKWSTQARENAPWYQHEELGFNYRMSNVIAGVIRGQLAHVEEHLQGKKEIFERYKEGLKDLPVCLNPYEAKSSPNFWLSCMMLEKDAMCRQDRTQTQVSYVPEHGKSCPTEILEAIASVNAEGRPIWKPMHMQPIYKTNAFVTENEVFAHGYEAEVTGQSIGGDIFHRGLCLPSDINMTSEEQDRIIEVIKACFA